jgi:hypothetical protein
LTLNADRACCAKSNSLTSPHLALCVGSLSLPSAAKLAVSQALTRSVRLRAAISEPESSAALEATTRLGWDVRGLHVLLDETAEGVVSMGMEGRLNSAICAVNPWLSGLVSACPSCAY